MKKNAPESYNQSLSKCFKIYNVFDFGGYAAPISPRLPTRAISFTTDRIWAYVCRDETIDYYVASILRIQNFNYYPLTMLKY